MRKGFKLATLLAALFLGCGCNDPILYNSTNPPINLTTDAGEIYGSGWAGPNGYNLGGGFSLPSHIQVAFGYTSLHKSEDKSIDNMKAQEYLIGVYHDFGPVILEAFLGAGTGEGSSKVTSEKIWGFSTETNTIEGTFDKLIGQINLGTRRIPFESGISIRVSDLNFHKVKKTNSRSGVVFEGSEKTVLWEPSVFGSIGSKNIRFRLMATAPIANSLKEVTYLSLFFSAGITLCFCL